MSMTPAIKDATEAIQNIPPLVDAFTKLLATPIGWALLIGLFIWFVVNRRLYTFFDFAEKRERQRLESLDTYVAKPDVADPESIRVASDIRDAYYFKLGTGIYAEKRFRTSLIWLHGKTSYLITWKQIRRALPYIESTPEGTASVRDLSTTEKFGYWYNELIAYLSLLATAGIFAVLLLSNLRSLSTVALGIGGTIAALALAMFAFTQNFPEKTARRIKRELEKPKPSSSAPNA
jgi:uncharacterized membrane protein